MVRAHRCVWPNAKLPAAVDEVLQRGLAASPKARYESCLGLVEALDSALTAGRVAQRWRPWTWRRYVAVAVAAASLALAVPLYKMLKPASRNAARQVLESGMAEASATVPAAIVAEADCVNPKYLSFKGAIRILSGTGPFEHVSPGNKTVAAPPGGPLNGTLTLRVSNRGPVTAYAPLIGTVSWGNHSDGYWKAMASIMPGEYTFPTRVHVNAPARAGTYHILFAMAQEYEDSNVASATNWLLHRDVWDDGNDIAGFSRVQIAQAQKYGCTIDQWLDAAGRYAPVVVPADAITVHVR